ncbi:MAG TPA: hypothetical protein PLU53_04240 [Bacteroidia bacterium]|nr:hypothetical protein [Bacteroidia bacterium]
MNRIVKIFDRLVFGNLFIGLCSVALVFTTFLLNDIPIQLTPSVSLVFFATWFYYNFHHHSHHLEFDSLLRFRQSIVNLKLNAMDFLFLVIPAIGIIISLLALNVAVLVTFLTITLFSLLYSIPLVKWNGRRRRLRESLLLKLPFLSLSWAAVTAMIPLLEQNQHIDTANILGQAFARALFIYGLCIPFEIRDFDTEKRWGTNTLPVVYGIRITKITGILILGVGIILRHIMKGQMILAPAAIFALDLSFLFAMLWILMAKSNPPKYFCKIYVDGTMILQFIFVYLTSLMS